MKCPKCGDTDLIKQEDGTFKCSSCGEIVRPSFMKEGKDLASGLAGTARVASDMVNNAANAVSAGRIDRKIAMLLAFFLGWCGAQFFYTHRMGYGILMIVLCFLTGGTVPAIVGLINCIQFLTMSDQEFIAKYDKK